MVDVKVPTGPPRRTQLERRETTRASLLASATLAVVDTGPSTAVADVARRAGVSTGALQYHFPTKTELLVAVVENGWNDLVARTMSAPRSGSPAERVASLVWSVWEAYQQPACRAAFIVSTDPNRDPVVAERIDAAFASARARLDEIWADTFVDLDLPIERITTARRFARSHLNGMVVQRQMASVEPDPDDELTLLCHTVLRILTQPSTA
jgi:AcrR family transcriptional regulator